jgi:hypothetical protein
MDLKKTFSNMVRGAYTAILVGSGNTAAQSPFLARLFGEGATLASFFNALFKTAIVVGAMLAILRLGYAGFIYMTTDSFGTIGNAKRIIGETVMGLLLLLATWLILNQINPQILNLNILQNVRPSNPSGQSPDARAPCPPGQTLTAGGCSILSGGATPVFQPNGQVVDPTSSTFIGAP